MKMVVCDNFFVVLHIKSYFNAKHGSYFFLTFLYLTQGRLREAFKNKKQKKYGIFHTLVGWVGLRKSFSIKIKNKKHGLKMPKIA